MTFTDTSDSMDSKLKNDRGPGFGARHIQVLLVSIGAGFVFATKSLMSVAIVAMTDNTTSSNPNIPTYEWTNTNVIISSLLWTGIPFNLLAGFLGKKYGPKWLIVIASIIDFVFFMLVPLSAEYGGSTGVIVCRLVQGLAFGCIFPLQSVVLGRWIPPEERSRLSFFGAAILTLVVMAESVVTGYIASSDLGWPWVFYGFGILGLIWTALYTIFGAQSFNVHKTISKKEKAYLSQTIFNAEEEDIKTPWCQMFSSAPFWAIVVGATGINWSIILLATEMSIYYAKVLKFSLTTNGLISSLPTVVALIAGLGLAYISDLIPNKGILSVLNSRRLFQVVGMAGLSVSLIFTTYVPVEHRIWAVVLLCIGNIFLTSSSVGGANTNILDVSPKYAGIIGGTSQTVSQSIALFAPLLVQWVCADESDPSEWRIVFLISGGVCIATAIFFTIFASGELQKWGVNDQEAAIKNENRKNSILSLSAAMPL